MGRKMRLRVKLANLSRKLFLKTSASPSLTFLIVMKIECDVGHQLCWQWWRWLNKGRQVLVYPPESDICLPIINLNKMMKLLLLLLLLMMMMMKMTKMLMYCSIWELSKKIQSPWGQWEREDTPIWLHSNYPSPILAIFPSISSLLRRVRISNLRLGSGDNILRDRDVITAQRQAM